MIFYGIHSQKQFDSIWKEYKKGSLELVQNDQYVAFFKGNTLAWTIDYPAFYNFFKEKKHGEDPITWGK